MTDHTIILGATGSPQTTVQHKDTVRWTNETGFRVTSFTLPSCVKKSSDSPAPIEIGATTSCYEVKHDVEKKSYGYCWVDESGDLGTRSGTIDVN